MSYLKSQLCKYIHECMREHKYGVNKGEEMSVALVTVVHLPEPHIIPEVTVC